MNAETCCNRLRYECDTGETLSWPDPRDPHELAWRLRYAQDGITKADMYDAAAFIESYGHLFFLDVRTRNKRMSEVRRAMEETNSPVLHCQEHIATKAADASRD